MPGPEEIRTLVVALDVGGNAEIGLILQRDLIRIRPYDVIRDNSSYEFGIENLAGGRDGVKFGGRGSKISRPSEARTASTWGCPPKCSDLVTRSSRSGVVHLDVRRTKENNVAVRI